MIRGECIVCFAPDPWSDIWRNRHRLLSIFARHNRVLYVEPRTPLRAIWRRWRGGQVRLGHVFRPRVEEVMENLFVYHDPLHLPRTPRRPIGPFVERRRDGLFRSALRRLECSAPILWLVRPESADVPGKYGEKLLLYQVVDDYLSYPGVTESARARLDRDERGIASRADLVVVTSEHLLGLKSHLHRRMVLVRNGVDAGTIEEGRAAGGATPAELRGLPRPIHGYIGGITEKLDLVLLEKIGAQAAAGGGSLVLVGPTNVAPGEAAAAIARLRALPAVVFTGKKDARDVPAYVRAFDVCLIPYRLGEQSRAIDPLKIYEYLAFGKPAVAVDIPSMKAFTGVVRVAKNHDEFLVHIREAAAERDERLVAIRRALAAENTWERRAEQISEGIEAALREKAGVKARA